MITKYKRLEPAMTAGGDRWVNFAYDDVDQMVTLYDSDGDAYTTYPSSRQNMEDWIPRAIAFGTIAFAVDADILLDIGL